MKVTCEAEQSNTPKKKRVKELTMLFASYDTKSLKEFLAEDIQWTLVGDSPIHGRDKFISALESMKGNSVVELKIKNIIVEGQEAAISGEMKMKGGNVFGFSDFYVFSNEKTHKVKSIRSYVILKNEILKEKR